MLEDLTLYFRVYLPLLAIVIVIGSGISPGAVGKPRSYYTEIL